MFLLLAIAFTVTVEYKHNKTPVIVFDDSNQSDSDHKAVSIDDNEVDREGNIARLKQKIADSGFISSAVSVISKSEEVDESETETTESPNKVTLMNCSVVSDGVSTMQAWSSNAELVSGSSDRSVVSTGLTGETVTLIQLPLYPIKSASPTCLDSGIVGVTLAGSLIFNSDAPAYAYTGQDELIGYARDGFPIYGQYSGEVDACGGYQGPNGYRYTTARDRTFMIGCFAGIPRIPQV